MTSVVVLSALFALVGATVGAVGLGAAWRQRQTAEHRRHALIDLEQELQRVQRKHADRDERTAYHSARQAQALESVQAELGETTLARDAAETELQRVRAELARRERDVARWSEQIEQERRTRASLERHLATARQRLAAVGIGLEAEARQPLHVEARPASQEQLEDLLVTTACEATAIVDERGHDLLGAGDPRLSTRTGAVLASLQAAAPAMAGWLCAPVEAWSSRAVRSAHHLLRLDDEGHWLGTVTLQERPTFAMHHARLRLMGQPPARSIVPELPDMVLDLDDAPDRALSERLQAWATQHAVQAATLLGPDGRPLATTASAQPGAATQVRRALAPWLERVIRDEGTVDGAALCAYDAEGIAATFRMLGPTSDACAVLTLGPASVSDRALDDLAGLVRWHRQPNPSQQAS